jgi:hypothetical protein
MAQCHQILHLAHVHVAVFQVQPDAIIAVVSCVTDKKGKYVPQSTETGKLAISPFRQNFAFSQGKPPKPAGAPGLV